MKRFFFIIWGALLVSFSIGITSVRAQTVTVLNDFSYGTTAILKNDVNYGLTVGPANSSPLTYNPTVFAIIDPPVRARVRLQGFPPNIPFSVTVAATPVLQNGVGPKSFNITNVEIRPNTLTTNGSGRRNVRFGSTLETSGDGTAYSSDTYTGSVLITIFY